MSSGKYTFYDEDTSISLVLPEEWHAGKHKDFDFMIIGPSNKGYKSNIGFSLKEIGPLTPEVLDKIISNTKKDQVKNYNEFEEVQSSKKMINEHPIWIQQYRWKDEESGMHFSQILMLAVLEEELLLEVNGATLESIEKEFIPHMVQIVESFRYI